MLLLTRVHHIELGIDQILMNIDPSSFLQTEHRYLYTSIAQFHVHRGSMRSKTQIMNDITDECQK